MEEHCLLVCSRPFRALAGLELRDWPASACPVLGLKVTPHPALLITNQEKTPTGLPTGQSHRGIFSTKALASQMSVCVKLTKIQPKQNANACAQGPTLLSGQCGQDNASCVTGILSPVLLRAVVVTKHSAN